MTAYQKGLRKIDAIIATAERSIAKRGQRENYPYDQQDKLEHYLNGLDLTYAEKCLLRSEFYHRCAGLTPRRSILEGRR